LLAESVTRAATLLPAILVAAAALTDYADGLVARRSGATEAGARWDMEADALLMFAVAAILVVSRGFPGWMLLIGVFRYLFVFIFSVLPGFPGGAGGRAFSLVAKGACALAVVTLLIALLPAFPRGAALVLNAVSLTALAVSFGWETLLRLASAGGR
jgi:phosphatidylglycerophosphate synthase